MHFNLLDKTLQAKLNQFKSSAKKPQSSASNISKVQSSINFYPSSEIKPYNIFIPQCLNPTNLSASCEKFHRSFEKSLEKTPSYPKTTVKRPQSSHNPRKLSPGDLDTIEKDIEKLKKENYLVSQKLDRFMMSRGEEVKPERKSNLFAFINNQGQQNSIKTLTEENYRLERSIKKLSSRLEDRKRELQKAFSLLQDKEKELQDTQEKFMSLKEEFQRVFQVIEGKYQLKFDVLEAETREKVQKILELEEILRDAKEQNNRLMGEREGFRERMKSFEKKLEVSQDDRNLKKIQNQWALTLNKKEKDLQRTLKELEIKDKLLEDNMKKLRALQEEKDLLSSDLHKNDEEFKDFKSKNEEKFRGIYAELLNLKLEKKSLLSNNSKLKEEKKGENKEIFIKNENLLKEISLLRGRIEEKDLETERIVNNYKSLENENQILRTEKESLEKKIEDNKIEINSLEANLADKNKEILAFFEKNNLLEKEKKQFSLKITEKNEKTLNFKDFEDLSKKIKTLESEKKALENSISSNFSRIQSLEQEKQEKMIEINRFTQRISVLELEKVEFVNKTSNFEENLADKTAYVQRIQALELEKMTLERDINIKNFEINSLSANYKTLEMESKDILERNKGLDLENYDKQAEINNLNEKLEIIENSIQKEKHEKNLEIHEKIKFLEKSLETEKQENNEKKVENQKITEKLKILERSIESETNCQIQKIKKLEKSLETETNEKNEKIIEIQKLNEKIKIIEKLSESEKHDEIQKIFEKIKILETALDLEKHEKQEKIEELQTISEKQKSFEKSANIEKHEKNIEIENLVNKIKSIELEKITLQKNGILEKSIQINEKNIEIQVFIKKLEIYENEKQALQKELIEKSFEIQSFSAKIKVLEQEKEKLNAEIFEKSKEIEHLLEKFKTEKINFENQIKEKSKELEKTLKNLENNKKSSENDINEKSVKIENLLKKLEILENQLNEKSKEIQAFSNERKTFDLKNNEIIQLKNKLKALEIEKQTVENEKLFENAKFNNKIEAMENDKTKELVEKTNKLKIMEQDYQRQISEKSLEIQNCLNKIAALESQSRSTQFDSPQLKTKSRPNILSIQPEISNDPEQNNLLFEELNQTKNSLIALKIENYNLKESVDVKIKKIEDLSTKIKTLETEKEALLGRFLCEKEEMINKIQAEQKNFELINEKIKAEFEQKLLESNRNQIKTTTERDLLESNRNPLEIEELCDRYGKEVTSPNHETNEGGNELFIKTKSEKKLFAENEERNRKTQAMNPIEEIFKKQGNNFSISPIIKEITEPSPLNNEENYKQTHTEKNKKNFVFQEPQEERPCINKRIKTKEELKDRKILVDMRQSMDVGIELRMRSRLKQMRLLLKIYENLLNEILNSVIREEVFEGFFKELDQRNVEHVRKVLAKMSLYLKKQKEKENDLLEKANNLEKNDNISLLNLQDEWDNGVSISYFNETSPIVKHGKNPDKIDEILEENKELILMNSQMDAQIQSLQLELQEMESNEEKYFQQVGILKQELKRLELIIKETDTMFHEKEHIKTNLIKFLETAGAKRYLESEEYLKVLFSMLGINELERELLIQNLTGKTTIDKKKGLISILFKR